MSAGAAMHRHNFPRRVAELSRARIGECATIEVPCGRIVVGGHPLVVAARRVRVAGEVRPLPAAEQPQVGIGRAGGALAIALDRAGVTIRQLIYRSRPPALAAGINGLIYSHSRSLWSLGKT